MLLHLLLTGILAPPVGVLPPGATPATQTAGTIEDADYPTAAAGTNQSGRTRVSLSIDRAGQVTQCRVAESSGSAVLDATSCALILQRFRYAPARDAHGGAIASTVARSIVWRLPAAAPVDPSSLAEFAAGQVIWTTGTGRNGVRCAVETSDAALEAIADGLCPASSRVQPSALASLDQGGTIVASVIPEGSPEPTRPQVRGDFVGRVTSELEIGPDGRIVHCSDVADPGASVALPGLCDGSPLLSRFRPDAAGRTRHGRVQFDIYRFGYPAAARPPG
jgi:TonB family protein